MVDEEAKTKWCPQAKKLLEISDKVELLRRTLAPDHILWLGLREPIVDLIHVANEIETLTIRLEAAEAEAAHWEREASRLFNDIYWR